MRKKRRGQLIAHVIYSCGCQFWFKTLSTVADVQVGMCEVHEKGTHFSLYYQHAKEIIEEIKAHCY